MGACCTDPKEDYEIEETNSMETLLELMNNRTKQLIMIKNDIDSYLENKSYQPKRIEVKV